MSSERAAFKAQVTQVEQWWKVWPIMPVLACPISHISTAESTVRSSQATVHRRAGRLKARLDPHHLPFRYLGQEVVGYLFPACEE